jgi:hypothetical protein
MPAMSALDSTMLERVMQPIETANGLPNAFYTDADVFEAEKRVLFAATGPASGLPRTLPETVMQTRLHSLGSRC